MKCNGQHKHASWAPQLKNRGLNFPTAQEAAYPALLCKRVAVLARDYAIANGASAQEGLQDQLLHQHETSHRWVLGLLPRGRAFKPLVSEFQDYKTFLNPPDNDPDASPFVADCPKGARVAHRRLEWGTMRVDESKNMSWEATDRSYDIAWAPIVWVFRVNLGTSLAGQSRLDIRGPWQFT